MRASTRFSLKTALLAVCAALALFALVPGASATAVRINFSGTLADPGGTTSTPFSGYADLQLGPDPLASSTFPVPTLPPQPGGPTAPLPPGSMSLPSGTPRVDPPGAQVITGASGMFNGVAITGVLPIAAQTDPNPNEYIPGSRTTLATTNFGAITYSDLFYADGSPLTCLWYYGQDAAGNPVTAAKYPFPGGFLDIYGVLFALQDNTFVDLWSNGVMPGLGLNYGAIRFMPSATVPGKYEVLDLQFNGVRAAVPEPNYLWLLGAVLLGVFAWHRMTEARKGRRHGD